MVVTMIICNGCIEMCHAAESQANAIAGSLILLQLWAQDRFPNIAPHQLFRHHIDVGVDAAGRLDSHTFQVCWTLGIALISIFYIIYFSILDNYS